MIRYAKASWTISGLLRELLNPKAAVEGKTLETLVSEHFDTLVKLSGVSALNEDAV